MRMVLQVSAKIGGHIPSVLTRLIAYQSISHPELSLEIKSRFLPSLHAAHAGTCRNRPERGGHFVHLKSSLAKALRIHFLQKVRSEGEVSPNFV